MALLLAPHPHTALLRHATPPPRLCYTAPPPQLCYFARTPKLCYFARTPQLSYVAPPPRRALLLCSASPLLIVLPLLRLSLLNSLSHRQQNNKVKDTNNRNARVIYDAKEVINGLQAPIVKDAEMDNVDKRPGMLRSPKYTNKRVDEVFSARKSKFGVVSGKENAKENPSLEKTTTSNLKNVLVFSTSAAKRQQGSSCMENSATSGEVNNDAADKSSGLTAVDVGKALRGLAAPKPCARTGLAADSTERCGDMISSFAANSISEYHILGQKAPLDLTLKTGQNVRGSQGFKVLHSWMYPQSILPPSLTSVLSSSTADAGDRFFWFRDEEFARQTVVGLNPLSISLVEVYACDAVALKSVAYSGKMKVEKRSLWSWTASLEKRSLFPNAKSVALGAEKRSL
ncbi:hypothetical protein Ahy_A07g035899 [Arachis hypogaea]|uniref:Lipoxygenase domain-containing protein n=1 Tax=Arachis hypogaea TaxID=3818 RepID=A0A445CEN2_ARAHY|nr:hypothetical protein Ahy_A07g035899 [Arachis hypogaea]